MSSKKKAGYHILPLTQESSEANTDTPPPMTTTESEKAPPRPDQDHTYQALQEQNDWLERRVHALEEGLTTFGEVLKGLLPELGASRMRFPFQLRGGSSSASVEDTTPPSARTSAVLSSPTPWAITGGQSAFLLLGTGVQQRPTRSLSPSPSTSNSQSGLPANRFEVLSDHQTSADEDVDMEKQSGETQDMDLGTEDEANMPSGSGPSGQHAT